MKIEIETLLDPQGRIDEVRVGGKLLVIDRARQDWFQRASEDLFLMVTHEHHADRVKRADAALSAP